MSELPGGGCTGCQRRGLTLVGAVGVRLVAVVPTVVIPITGPVFGDAAAAVALELGAGAGVAAAGFIAVVPTVIVWGGGRGEWKMGSAEPPSV